MYNYLVIVLIPENRPPTNPGIPVVFIPIRLDNKYIVHLCSACVLP